MTFLIAVKLNSTIWCDLRDFSAAQDIGFQFMNKVTVMDRIVNFTCTHAHWGHHTAMEGSVAFDFMNKVRIGYGFGSGNWRVKYVYAHGLRTVVEPWMLGISLCRGGLMGVILSRRGITLKIKILGWSGLKDPRSMNPSR